MSANAIYPSLSDRSVLVTGGASRIGRAVARAFAMQHAAVTFFDIDREGAAATIELAGEEGRRRPVFHQVDLCDTETLHAFIARIVEAEGPFDVLAKARRRGWRPSDPARVA